jgi:hypothetical protein
MAFAVRFRWLGLVGGGGQLVVLEGLLDAPGGGGADALVDCEGLPQVRFAVSAVPVVEVGLADSFEGACFLEGYAEVAGDRKRPGVALAGLAGGRGRRG